MKYTVYVNENSHYMDESERYMKGEYAEAQEAIDVAREIVDESVASLYKPGMTAESLYRNYQMFGEDPFIISGDASFSFSAWDYAKKKCNEICS